MIRTIEIAKSVIVAAAVFAAVPPAHAACPLLGEFNRAVQARNLGEVLRLEDKIAGDAECGNLAVAVKRGRADLQVRLAERLPLQNAEYESLLAAADATRGFWRASRLLGDWRFKQRRFVDATIAYERALEVINDTSATPNAPDSKTTKEIYDQAMNARLLAANEQGPGQIATLVPTPKNTRGEL